jgi:seryl-tRNA synthetase
MPPQRLCLRFDLFYSSFKHAARRRYYIRPSVAPKPALDIKHIRQNPGLYEQNCEDRNYPQLRQNSWKIIDLFKEWQECQHKARGLRERNNLLRRKIANSASISGDVDDNIASPEDRESILAEARALKEELSGIEEKEDALQAEIEQLALDLPNLSSMHTPVGTQPEVLGYINDHPEPPGSASDRVWKSHVHIGSELGLMDFSAAANTSGWGWYFLLNEGALLEQALVQHALHTARARGWTVVAPPSVVYAHVAAACGFQPRDQHGEQQIYALEQAGKDGGKPPLALAGTGEIPLAAMRANDVLEAADLPLKYVGVSRCYRAEAGARGVDTKGLYRVHEFTKVEMFAWTLPDNGGGGVGGHHQYFSEAAAPDAAQQQQVPQSQQLFDEMLSIQREILQSLGLHCRVLEQPTTDLGASAARKLDIEAFFPSRRAIDDGWGELTSLSLCTDYQSRRLHTRVRADNKERKLDFPYTLNGTALAVPRVLACILENGWNDRTQEVVIPEALRPYMGGMETIRRKR